MAPPEELVVFCQREHPRLVGALALYCGDRAAAEELGQEALARACERWEKVSRMAAPGAWVHRVAMNAATSRFRRRAAERRALGRLSGPAEVGVDDPDGADAVTIRLAVAALPARQAQALVLRFFLQLSVAETAQWMQVSDAAVKSLTQRGLAGLREQLQPLEHGDGSREVDDVTR